MRTEALTTEWHGWQVTAGGQGRDAPWRELIHAVDAGDEHREPAIDCVTGEAEHSRLITLAGARPVRWTIGIDAGWLRLNGVWRTRVFNGRNFGYQREWPFEINLPLPDDIDPRRVSSQRHHGGIRIVLPRVRQLPPADRPL